MEHPRSTGSDEVRVCVCVYKGPHRGARGQPGSAGRVGRIKILDNIQTKAFQVEISTAEQWRREVARPVHGWLTCPWRNVPSVG